MLHYDRIHVSKAVDTDKANASKECNICHYWYFLDKTLKFQPYVCNGCHDLLIMPMNLRIFGMLGVLQLGFFN